MSDPLHWLTSVTKSVELLVNVPLPPGQASSEHCRVRVVVDDVVPELMLLTTVTVHVIPVVAPAAHGPTLLHWSSVMAAAAAGDAPRLRAATDNDAASTTGASSVIRTGWRAERE